MNSVAAAEAQAVDTGRASVARSKAKDCLEQVTNDDKLCMLHKAIL